MAGEIISEHRARSNRNGGRHHRGFAGDFPRNPHLIVLRQLLTAQGYEILHSSEGWDGINRARNEQPDLIVMDINLPDISGLDATLLLKKDDQTKNIPIIAVTAFVTPADKANALSSGCDAYIAKPVNMSNLLGTVETFLSSSSA